MNQIARAVDKYSPVTAAVAKTLKSNGISAIGRYLTGEGKALTPAEVSIITSAGLSIMSVYETNPTQRSYFTHAQGVADAKAAVTAAKTIGQPPGTPIYFTVDYDCQDADMPSIRDYFDGVRSAIGGYKVGIYGGLRAVSNVAADFYWQTRAWSPSVSPRAAIYQSQCDTTFAGIRVDIDQILKPCGAWPKEVGLVTGKPTFDQLTDHDRGWSGFDADVKWAYDNDILGHYSDNTIRRLDAMSREQFAYAIHTVVKKLQAGQLKG